MNVAEVKSGGHSIQDIVESNFRPRPAGLRRKSVYSEPIVLPLGYVDEGGVRHDRVELLPLSGFEEDALASVAPNISTSAVVTALLVSCVRSIGSIREVTTETVADLLLGDREYLMIKLRELTLGKKVDAVLFCGDAACGKPMDVTLSLDNFVFKPQGLSRRFFVLEIQQCEDGGKNFLVEFRLPTGADQEMAVARGASVEYLLSRMLVRVNDQTSIDEQFVRALPASVKLEIEAEMERLAPSSTIELEATCPECGKSSVSAFDPVAFFLTEISKSLRSLEREVHFLASHYHWTEHDILALPRRRRQRYIELIQGESSGDQMSLSDSRGRWPA